MFKFNCEVCDYHTNDRSNFNKHTMTRKHLRKVKKNVIKVENEYEIYKATKPFMNKNNIIIFMGAGSITNWAKNFILKY